jgi:hypothetical protein
MKAPLHPADERRQVKIGRNLSGKQATLAGFGRNPSHDPTLLTNQ